MFKPKPYPKKSKLLQKLKRKNQIPICEHQHINIDTEYFDVEYVDQNDQIHAYLKCPDCQKIANMPIKEKDACRFQSPLTRAEIETLKKIECYLHPVRVMTETEVLLDVDLYETIDEDGEPHTHFVIDPNEDTYTDIPSGWRIEETSDLEEHASTVYFKDDGTRYLKTHRDRWYIATEEKKEENSG